MSKVLQAVALGAAAVVALAGAGAPALAQSHEKDLVVYVSHPSEMADYFAQAFGDKYGVKVTTVKAGTGELLNRIRAERGRPGADVMWGGFSDTGKSATELFDQYRSKALVNVEPAMIGAFDHILVDFQRQHSCLSGDDRSQIPAKGSWPKKPWPNIWDFLGLLITEDSRMPMRG